MGKRFYKSALINVDDSQIRLDYYILCEDYDLPEGTFGISSYGIEVQKVCGQNVQSVSVYDICCSEDKIIKLAQLLCENSVMPVTVCDVITDLLEDNFFEDSEGSAVIAS